MGSQGANATLAVGIWMTRLYATQRLLLRMSLQMWHDSEHFLQRGRPAGIRALSDQGLPSKKAAANGGDSADDIWCISR
jgi:hypothetical protein